MYSRCIVDGGFLVVPIKQLGLCDALVEYLAETTGAYIIKEVSNTVERHLGLDQRRQEVDEHEQSHP
jgi:hypothetical protein